MSKSNETEESIVKPACGLTTVPEVDNSQEECDGDYKSANCILFTKSIPMFGIMEGDSLQNGFEKMQKMIKAQARLIKKLEERLNIT